MTYKSIILPQAKNEIREAARYYNDQKTDLGLRFLKEVKSRVASISKQPEIYQIRYRTVRMALLKKFPYSIHYCIDDENKHIVVLALFHQAQDPTKWDREEK